MIPNPPRLSEHVEQLRSIEESHWFSNFGPVNTRFERTVVGRLFGSVGAVTTVCNATIGLILAIAAVISERRDRRRRFAVLPSFTFAATAHAALWCGLDLLFCDVERDTWNPSLDSMRELCAHYGEEIAVLLPCTTFGNGVDVAAWSRLGRDHGIPLVFDAAAALGSTDDSGVQTGAGSEWPFVYSLHATKAFATAEAGLVYSADGDVVRRIRQMANFGFDASRMTTMPGLNGKLSEHAALLCEERLRDFDSVAAHRQALFDHYRRELPHVTFQVASARRRAYQFCPIRLDGDPACRDRIVLDLARASVEARTYFSPALHAMAFFAARAEPAALPNTEWLSQRVVSLPIYDAMTFEDVEVISAALRAAMGEAA